VNDFEKTKDQLIAELQETRHQLQKFTVGDSRNDGHNDGRNDGSNGRTAAELRHSEEMFLKAFRTSPDMIIISSVPGGQYLEVNDAFAKNVGYSQEELLGHTLAEYNFFSTPEESERMMGLLRTQGTFHNQEFTFRVRSGEIQHWLCSAEAFSIDDKKLMISVAADISKMKQMEQALIESENKLSMSFRAAPYAMVIVTLGDGIFVEVNDYVSQITGYTHEQLIGHSAFELKIWDSSVIATRLGNTLREKGKISNLEIEWRSHTGEILVMLMSAELIEINGKKCIICGAADVSYLKKIERNLRESEEKFSKAFTSSPTSICLFSPIDTRFLEVNDSYLIFSGYSREEVINHTPEELNLWVYPQERESMANSLQSAGKIANLRIHSRRKNGEIRIGLFSAQAFETNGKKHVILSINDVTDQVKAEEAIASEAMLRRVMIENSRDGIVIIDEEGKVFDANRKYCEMLGYTREEIKHLNVWDWDTAIKREKLDYMVRTVDENGDHFETRHRRKDGTIYDVEISSSGTYISGKKMIFCVCRDITERKSVEKALRESEELFSKAFHSNPEASAITTLQDGTYIDINDNYIQSLGYSREELVGHTAKDLGIWADIEERADLYKTLSEYGKVNKKEYRFRAKSGDIHTWLFSAEPLVIGGQPCLLGVSLDITNQKLIEAKVQEAENLQLVEKLRRELLANVSHELRTPLAGIKGFTTMLLDYGKRLKANEKRDYLETIDKNADRMVELIEQLIEMSRLGAGMVMIRKKSTNVNKLCRTVIDEAQERAPDHAFILDLPRKLPMIEIDDARIKQVLDHIIDNAVKYSKAMTKITLSVRKAKEDLLFCVTDHGSGIPKEDIPHIFERMFMSRHKTQDGTTGAGLGLTICKGLVEAHNGKIWVESEEGVGSRCFFTLPIMSPTAPSEKSPTEKIPPELVL
jgi:PAS domain S-box-containing protein